MVDSLTHLSADRGERDRLAATWGISRFEFLSTTNTTQEVARHLAEWEHDDWVLVVTDYQTGGRGQHGRKWIAPPGASLMFSLAMRPRSATQMALIPIRVGIAIARALDGVPGLRLKWPNDLMCGERKCGGILCEGTIRGEETLAVIGVGVNVRPFTVAEGEIPGREPAFLVDLLGEDVQRLDLLSIVIPAIRHGLEGEELSDRELAEYRQRDWLLGRAVTAPVAGRAAGIDRNGHLLIEREDGGVETVVSGRVELAP